MDSQPTRRGTARPLPTWVGWALAGSFAAALAACVLNPQPIPPESTNDSDDAGGSSGGSDPNQGSSGGAGVGGSSSGGGDGTGSSSGGELPEPGANCPDGGDAGACCDADAGDAGECCDADAGECPDGGDDAGCDADAGECPDGGDAGDGSECPDGSTDADACDGEPG